jgi:hypothetical protein
VPNCSGLRGYATRVLQSDYGDVLFGEIRTSGKRIEGLVSKPWGAMQLRGTENAKCGQGRMAWMSNWCLMGDIVSSRKFLTNRRALTSQ